MNWSIRDLVLPGYLLLCLLLGGSSAANWGNLALQMLALPLIFWALAVEGLPAIPPCGRKLFLILCALVVLIVLHVVPLPPGLWTQLPGRESVVRSYELMGQPLPWLPLSLAPYRTVTSAMWLLPPVAILLAIVRLRADRPALLSWAMIGVTVTAVLLGVLQIATGTGWYVYEFTNIGGMTGFFANSNHLATSLLVTFPFAAALYVRGATGRKSSRGRLAWRVMAGVAPLFLFVCLVAIQSLAAVVLMLPVVAASMMMIWRTKRRAFRGWWLLLGGLGAASAAVVFSPVFEYDRNQLQGATSQFSRYYGWTRTLAAAADVAPFGSGLGTFVNVYPRYEDPSQVEMTYMNHAHNEYLEVTLEMGAAGLVLVATFLLWWVRQTWRIWRDPGHREAFAQAATIASGAILLHSIVDYPIRMTAISAVFALCCGLMITAQERMSSGKESGSVA